MQCQRPEFDPQVKKIHWRRAWLPIPALLPGESPGHKSLVGYCPQDCSIFWTSIHYWLYCLQISSPIHYMSNCLVDSFLHCVKESLLVWYSSTYLFLLLFPLCSTKANVNEHTAYVFFCICFLWSYICLQSILMHFSSQHESVVQFDFFVYTCPVFPTLFIEEVLFPYLICLLPLS